MLFRRSSRSRSLAALLLAAMVTWACAGGQPAAQPTATSALPAVTPPRAPSPAASPSPSPSPGPSAGQSYTVEAGDTMASIAQKFYGDAGLWRKIYDANKVAIGDDPDKLKQGLELKIPPKE